MKMLTITNNNFPMTQIEFRPTPSGDVEVFGNRLLDGSNKLTGKRSASYDVSHLATIPKSELATVANFLKSNENQ